MPPELKTWTCGQCQRTILVPPAHGDDWLAHLDTMARIREHRFGHLVDTLMHGSDEDLWGLSADDGEPAEGATISLDNVNAAMEKLRDYAPAHGGVDFGFDCAPPEPVDSDDATPVLEGIAELLRDDLPRAKQMWYPIRDDGSFNREED